MLCFSFSAAHIAPLIAASDTLTFFGSGMTVKFFALFFAAKQARAVGWAAQLRGGACGIDSSGD